MKVKVKNIILISLLTIVCGGLFALGLTLGLKHKTIIVSVNLEATELTVADTSAKYTFMPKELSDYICDMCECINLDPDLPVSLLLNENPKFNPEAIHKNNNGTIDVGEWQLNDYYLYTVFIPAYWKFETEFDAFNWKHNTYIALMLIKDLSDSLKIEDEIIMAYNCGRGAVINGNIPDSTYNYLASAKNNLAILRGEKND